jgi:hypothetical protein
MRLDQINGSGGPPSGKIAVKFLQFSTPWTGLLLANLQGFGKFVIPLPVAASLSAPHLGPRAAIIFTAAAGEIVGAVNRNIRKKNHVACGSTEVTAHIATRCPATRMDGLRL